jgi:hypothetical protein
LKLGRSARLLEESQKPGPNKEFDEDFHFFKMTLLSEQLNHKDFMKVRGVSTEELFQEAKFEQGLSFQNYHAFIKEELEKYYISKVKNADPDRFVGKQDELKDFNGVRLYVDTQSSVMKSPKMKQKQIPVQSSLAIDQA